jgi:hypothetical protein
MLVEVAKRNIRMKERSVLKGAFITKVFRLVSELTATKESPEGVASATLDWELA